MAVYLQPARGTGLQTVGYCALPEQSRESQTSSASSYQLSTNCDESLQSCLKGLALPALSSIAVAFFAPWKKPPETLEEMWQRAEKLLGERQFQDAAKVYMDLLERIREKNTNDPHVTVFDAVDDLAGSLQKALWKANLYLRLSQAYQGVGDYDSEFSAFRRAGMNLGGVDRCRTLRGSLTKEQHENISKRLQDIRGSFRIILTGTQDRMSKDSNADFDRRGGRWMELGEIYANGLDGMREALIAYREAARIFGEGKIFEKEAEAHERAAEIGQKSREEGEVRVAIKAWEKAQEIPGRLWENTKKTIKFFQGRSYAHQQLAKILTEKGSYADAAVSYREAAELWYRAAGVGKPCDYEYRVDYMGMDKQVHDERVAILSEAAHIYDLAAEADRLAGNFSAAVSSAEKAHSIFKELELKEPGTSGWVVRTSERRVTYYQDLETRTDRVAETSDGEKPFRVRLVTELKISGFHDVFKKLLPGTTLDEIEDGHKLLEKLCEAAVAEAGVTTGVLDEMIQIAEEKLGKLDPVAKGFVYAQIALVGNARRTSIEWPLVRAVLGQYVRTTDPVLKGAEGVGVDRNRQARETAREIFIRMLKR